MTSSSPTAYEDTHVHSVYEAIAPHFSATRHKPWPFITQFLTALPPGSIGLDIGCGNGKYIPVNPSLHILASDRSPALVKLARANNYKAQAITADSLSLPYRSSSVDFVICIAVIHHLSTRQRRQDAIAALLECLSKQGKALIYVWALEQESSRRGWGEGSEQDTLVPWVMRKKGNTPDETYQRYYHLYREGELEEDVRQAGGEVCESGYEKDNWWVILKNKS
ncbi:tRNA methyltransferase, has a role in tRNA modification [Conoideocrella luteorostrata]|uniref:tRNA methyltransferase, has a role in tRNA modification n=1 Tax=Conoideocrella luteorostrata TaxID=1105319 RepID=A0AAJ0CEE8_9HYPO|nr:tRNA methyltransferase, has a role in tRNA modification [Conoideocrella luteorostrata]